MAHLYVSPKVIQRRAELRREASRFLRKAERRPARGNQEPRNTMLRGIPATTMSAAFVAAIRRRGIAMPAERRDVVELVLALIGANR